MKKFKNTIADMVAAELDAEKETTRSPTTGLGARVSADILGTVEQDAADLRKGLKRAVDMVTPEKKEPESVAYDIKDWVLAQKQMDYPDLYDDVNTSGGEDVEGPAPRPPEDYPTPRLRGDAGSLSHTDNAFKLQRDSGDEEFVDSVEKLAEKYNITVNEVYEVIDGESKWDHTSVNPLGYKTLFQFGKDAITDINRFTDTNADYKTLENLTPSQQVALYDKHLERWGYDGSVPLAVMQAAPAKAKNLKGKPDSTIVYKVGSDAWKENRGWRSSENGPITLGSLKAYYNR